MKKIIPYGRQTIDNLDIKCVEKVLRSNYLTQGPSIDIFEKKLREYCGSKYAVVLNSGTAALHAAYFACGLSKNDEFITSPITFVATANAGLYLGAKPVFVDVNKHSGNIDASKIEKAITGKTRLIVPIHYGGFPADLSSISGVAKKRNLFIVEDASHALGAKYHKTRIGSCAFSDATVFSFHPIKHITTGEGGAVTTNNKNIYQKMLLFRSHGISKERFTEKSNKEGDWYYEMQELGFNYRLTDIQAALGASQLKKLGKFVKKRRRIVKIYLKAFKANPFFDIIEESNNIKSSYHLFPILLKGKYAKRKKEIFDGLRKKGIWVQVHYIPVCNQPYYKKLGYSGALYPSAQDFYNKEISIPIFPLMQKSDINRVIKTLFSILKNYD